MLRESLLYLSQSNTVKRLVTGTPISRRMAERFVAGETLSDVIRVAETLNASGLKISLDYLGESVTNPQEAENAVAMAIASVEQIAERGVDGNISIKPSAFGLDMNEELCRANIERVLTRARDLGDGDGEIFVRLDMESSDYTERTVEMVESLWADGFRNVGTVLQSYLRRTPNDIERLTRLGARIRLVKGAYQEPPSIAFPDKSEVDRMFIEEMKVLLEAGSYPAIATQDEAMIAATRNWAFERGLPKSSFEFQMLYGIRRDLQTRLVEEGYNVRIYVPYGNSWYPYLMRRMAERPANVMFITGNLLKESPAGRMMHPVAIGAGFCAGALAAMGWRRR